MITKEELEKRDWLAKGEIRELMQGLDVLPMDLVDELDITFTTWKQYLATKIPQKHFPVIIEFFQKAMENGSVKTNKKPSPKKEESTQDKQPESEPEPKPDLSLEDEGSKGVDPVEVDVSPQEEEETKGEESDANNTKEAYNRINSNFEHLDFHRIIFVPKEDSSVGLALQEAGEYAIKAGVAVHVKVKDVILKVEIA